MLALVQTTSNLREHGPIKQGLRLNVDECVTFYKVLREHGPIKQGLRHIIVILCSKHINLREHGPIKQGLRQTSPCQRICSKVSESMVQ